MLGLLIPPSMSLSFSVIVVRVVGDAGCERIHREEKAQREKDFVFTFPRERKDWVLRNAPAPALMGRGFEPLLGDWVVAEQDVAVGLVSAATCFDDVIFGSTIWAWSSRSGMSCFVSSRNLCTFRALPVTFWP